MSRAHKRHNYEMNEGDAVDASYTLHESHACGRGFGHRRGRGIRFLILFIILGAVFFQIQKDDRRVEAIANHRSPSAIAAPVEQGPFEDKVVRGGETISGDLVNYSGNVTVKDGGVVQGDLVLFSGNATIEEGGVVEGDVTVWSGNVTVRGAIGGDIAAMSGNIHLEDGAVVEGDVSSFSGNIERTGVVSVDGDVVSGITKSVPFWQKSDLPAIPAIPAIPAVPSMGEVVAPSVPDMPAVSSEPQWSFAERILFLFGRLVLGAFVTVAVTLLSIGVFSVRPVALTSAWQRMRGGMPGVFGLGAAVNFSLLLAMRALFAVGFCFAPVAVITFLGLTTLVVMGYGIVSRTVGERVLTAVNRSGSMDRKPVMVIAAGAFALTGALAVLSALSASTWVFAVGALLVSAPGVGALLLPWFDKLRNRKTRDLTSPGAPTTPAGPGAFGNKYPMPATAAASASAGTVVKPYAPARPVQPTPFGSASGSTGSAPAPTETLRAQQAAAATSASAASDLLAVDSAPATAAAATAAAGEWLLEPPTSLAQEAAQPYKFELPESPAPTHAGTPGVTVEELVQAAAADQAARDAVKAAEVAARERAVDVSIGDDLTRITGLGKSSERKLKGAGIVTFTQLAAVPAEMIATILGVPVEEVLEDEIIKQANALSVR